MELKDIQSTVDEIKNEVLNPHDQMDAINTLLKGIYSRIETAASTTELKKIVSEINKNRNFLHELLEIAEITMSVSNADGPDYEKVVRDLTILADEQEFEIYISKYEVYFSTIDRLAQFNDGIKTFLSLPYISADIKNKVRKIFDVLLEWVTNPNENNWLSLLNKELSRKGSVDEKIIFLGQVLRTLGNEFENRFKASVYHPHFPEKEGVERLSRSDRPSDNHIILAESKLKRIFSKDTGLLNAESFSLFYSDVNVGMNIILGFETFLKILKRSYEDLMSNTLRVREIGQSYESNSYYKTQLKIKHIDSNTLSYVSPGIDFASDLSFKESAHIIAVFSGMYKVEKGELMFTSLDILTAYCE